MASALAYWGWVAMQWRSVAMHAIDAYVRVHTPPTPAPAKAPLPIPASIMAAIYEWEDEGARESISARARELFEELHDWSMGSYQLSQEMGTP